MAKAIRSKERHEDNLGEGVASTLNTTDDDLPLRASDLTPSRLLQETWESYLAAKESGTHTQRSAALKAVYDQIQAQGREEGSQTSSRFQLMDDEELKAEIIRILADVSPELGVKAW